MQAPAAGALPEQETVMTDLHSRACETDSDDALVARLYELACGEDTGELARIDALVYERLLQAYGDDDQAAAA